MDPKLAQLREVRETLENLHKLLLAAACREYERVHGPITSRNSIIDLALKDPSFQWLRPLSQLLVDIADLMSGPVEEAEILDVRLRAKSILSSARYLDLLQTDPDVGTLHAPIRWALQRLGS